MLKSTYTKTESVVLGKRCYKNFSEDSFRNNLRLKLNNNGNFSEFNKDFNEVLDKHAPLK